MRLVGKHYSNVLHCVGRGRGERKLVAEVMAPVAGVDRARRKTMPGETGILPNAQDNPGRGSCRREEDLPCCHAVLIAAKLRQTGRIMEISR